MICSACGQEAEYKSFYPVDDILQTDWQLSSGLAKMFNMREGLICSACGSSVRAQGLASAIIDSKFGLGVSNLKDWVAKVNERSLKVCELNSCHELHKILSEIKNLTYAEYGTKSQQDIENLTYKDNTFDIILHSETLEHVNNPTRAMDECRRVINNEGLVLFTTPVVWTRKTKIRARKVGSNVEKIAPASYHGQKTEDYLVYREFGKDISSLIGCGVAKKYPKVQNYVFCSGKMRKNNIPFYKIGLYYCLQKLYERKAA